jgi:phosphoribosylformylglycinamidine (FGAM) synthase-like enzyme
MVIKGCQRCKGDLWVEEDIGSQSRDSVCVQCGSRQAIQSARVGPNTAEQTSATRWLMSQRPSRISAYGP